MKIVLDNIEKETDESFLYVLPTIIIKHIDDYLPKNIVDVNNYVNILIEDKYNIKKFCFIRYIFINKIFIIKDYHFCRYARNSN